MEIFSPSITSKFPANIKPITPIKAQPSVNSLSGPDIRFVKKSMM